MQPVKASFLLSLQSGHITNRCLRILLAGVFVLGFLATSHTRAFGQEANTASFDPIEEKDQDHPDQRAEWMRRGREAPAGQSAAALRLRAHQQKMAMRAQRAAAAARSGVPLATATPWVALGPAPLISDGNFFGNVTGRVTAAAVDPSDTTGNTVYVAGAYGGVWKSSNAANGVAANVTWTPVTDQQASLANGAVSVKSDGSVVLVGTGEPNNAIDSYYGVGVLRSTDKGATWTLIPSADSGAHPFAGLGFSKFAWIPGTNTVVGATATTSKGFDEGKITSSTARGLYRSTDNGVTWAYQAPTDGSTPISVTDVVYNATAGKFFAAIRYHGVYSSTDGTSWTRLANQPNPTVLSTTNCPVAVNPANPCPMYRGQFAVVPGRDETYFWFIDANLQNKGIWQSLNGGGTWTHIQSAGDCTVLDPDSRNQPCGMKQPFYNLELGAVPNGTGTDLYAGLVNLYKCNIASGSSTCATIDASVGANWINLTQVYTCPAISAVHPDEHGFAFMVVGGKAIMYFGNDGGIYRTLDGFTKLKSGTCGNANGFDNLNGTIGSMTQFVSFSVHPTDQNTLLGGTQDNGSPATTTATTSSQFFTANGGDGGYNAINPNNTSQWFAANTDVSIQVCNTAPNCTSAIFGAPIISNATVGNDVGPFYTPYILDPQSTGEILVGTCRIWRGSTAGTAFNTLSSNFDTGTAAVCTGAETNQIRSVAAAGPKDGSGFSNVVYGTSDGVGPNCTTANGCLPPGTSPGGEVWSTTNAATTLMSNVTGNINPANYTISSVAVDNTDVSGKTAYVGIMGFGVSHVFKTTNAGTSWTDWTGSGLPDAPVNALLVDAQAGKVYAGTDVGVFSSSTSSAAWTEVGTPAAPGATGYLPNVPVSAIRMFNSGGIQKLRVSTYGRGIWEYDLSAAPDFSIAVTATPSATVVNQNVTWNGTLTAVGGYNKTVTISCTGVAPATCTPNPAVLVPTAAGAAFTVTLGNPTTGTFNNFTIQGSDGLINHATPLETLTVNTDVGWTDTGNSSVTVKAGQSATYNFSAAPVGGATFTAGVTFACASLPALTNCAFNPTSISAGSGTTAVILTISTTGPNMTQARILADKRVPTPWLPWTLPIAGIVLAGFAGRKVSKYSVVAGLCVSLVLLGLLLACGSPSHPISVTVGAGNPSSLFPNNAGWPNQTAQFSATVSNDNANKGVTWSASAGSIDSTGKYTAPTLAPGLPATVTITATSVADPSKSGTAQETLKAPTALGTTSITVSATAAGASTGHSQIVHLTVQ